jgi:hypothetical protein
VLVWHHSGVQYDPAQHNLRWDARVTVSAEAKLVGDGAALFVVH